MHWLDFAYHFLAAKWRFHDSAEALFSFQNLRARAIIAYVRQHSPFYRRLYADHAKAAWTSLPTIDKETMMEHFDAFNTVGISRESAMTFALHAETTRQFRPTLRGFTVGLSSGTSGHRGLFLVSRREQSAWAGHLLARTLPPFRAQGFSIACFLRSDSNLYQTLGGRWLRFRYYDLMTPLEDVVARLNTQKPDFVVGPPSLLAMLVEPHRQGQLRIQPRRLISVAEVLEPQDHERLENAFSCPVHQIYQCTEGLLAISCCHGSLHLQEDLVAVQLEKLSTSEGTPNRYTPIVTDLWRKTQPILRYRLNDVVVLDARYGSTNPCPCGSRFRVLERIEGRCDDLLEFDAAQGGKRILFPDILRRMILLSSPQIRDYQIVQTSPCDLRIHLDVVPESDFDAIVRDVHGWANQTFSRYGCVQPRLKIERGLETVNPTEKRRRVRRMGF